uniref:Uncharacterized protein n=1 Tax=Pseudo-nitzschia australis TaxID=44445 RepID=A0A7S4ELR5_9STRA|mmetsp:Transcript_27673/g.60939  ORF Transcript_27673/g.60939 Transcript_27673/m.60939 type:complete len:530 (-) Transcript_27673:311-1900(-)|eukprot:CAMPEP_0168164422 /NCGR_PEP_ID=MMETSP0139_2-20121125/927_1 /TAXON_ID=44445 /ORGANISM="Pseudo-nitzschia australis, Strain 10249 10 AB" /LENGTH=529 /DNA_ID=CAMNT_0008081435 /DNA_START=111 /DNA_END=1700 /DNA_ORIENTATION=-
MIVSRSNSISSNYGLPPSSKAAEAELISKATQTAIVAARSILMNGGSQDVALKTAKAAAESVLNPAASDSDTISGKSTLGVNTLGVAFGGKKRKAKRQAEVVASMALMSANSARPDGVNMAGECDVSFSNRMYGRNIITVRHDEPSVLSGSFTSRPPKVPTPRSHVSYNKSGSFMSRSQPDETREGAPITRHASASDLYGKNKESRPSRSRSPLHSRSQSVRALSPTKHDDIFSSGEDDDDDDGDDGETCTLDQLDSDSLTQTSTMDSRFQTSVESTLAGRSESEDDESQTDVSETFHNARHNLNDKKEKESKKDAADVESKEKVSWNFRRALLVPVTATLNLMTCGQIASGDAAGDVEELESNESNKRQSTRGRVQTPMYESRNDTFDYSYDSGFKKSGSYRDKDFTSSYSESFLSSDSLSFTGTDNDSEGEIQVRSSIRETMENLVTKSKLSYRKSKLNDETRWESSEKAANDTPPRQRSPRKSSNIISPRNSGAESRFPPKVLLGAAHKNSKRRTSFFKKTKGRRR